MDNEMTEKLTPDATRADAENTAVASDLAELIASREAIESDIFASEALGSSALIGS